MADIVTKVLYDITSAIASLNKLNTKLKDTEDANEDAFGSGNSGKINKFDKVLDKIPGTAGKAARGVAKVGASFGAVAAGAAVAAAAIGSVIAQFVDLPGLTKDSIASLKAFEEATKGFQDVEDVISATGDAIINRDVELAKRAIKLDQERNAREQNLVSDARSAADQRLDALKSELDQREARVKQAVDREQDLRKKLEERTRQDPAAGFSGPIGKKALDLGAAARQAAFDGDIEKAEALEKAAKEAGEAAGNHNLFLRDQATTRDAINNKLKKEISAQAEVTSAEQQALDLTQNRVNATEQEIKLLKERQRLLTNESRELGAQQKRARVEGREAKETQDADQAARDFRTASKNLSNEVKNGVRSLKEDFIDSGRLLLKAATSIQERNAATDFVQRGAGASARIENVIGRASRDEAVTGEEVQALGADLKALAQVVGALKVANAEGRTPGREQDIARLDAILQSGLAAFQASADFNQVRGNQANIVEGSAGPTDADLQAARQRVLGLGEASNTATDGLAKFAAQLARTQIPGAPAQAAVAAATVKATPVVPPSGQGSSQFPINVNADVKGVLTREVITEIVEKVERELRKKTGKEL